MVYLVVRGQTQDNPLLVSGDSQLEVEERLNLRPDEKVAGIFTTAEIQALLDSSFGVITG